MRITEIITELFTSYGGYELHHNPFQVEKTGMYTYRFDTRDEREGEILIKPKHLFQGVDSIVFVEFLIDGSTDTSGKGDAVMIFSTVLKAVNSFARQHQPQYIVFETEDPEKLRLYRRLVKYFTGYQPIDWVKDPVLSRQIGPELSGFAEEAIVLQRQANANKVQKHKPAQGQYVIYGRGQFQGQVWHRFDLDPSAKYLDEKSRNREALAYASEWVNDNESRLGKSWLNYPTDWNMAKDPSGLDFAPAPPGQYALVKLQ
jgi:hypothetical protein